MKRQLKSSPKPIRIVFIEEPAFNAGGPLREFSKLYFDAASRNNVQFTNNSFNLLHNVKKLNNGDFGRFGLLIALALIYGCPGPRNMQESLVRAFLDLPINDGNISRKFSRFWYSNQITKTIKLCWWRYISKCSEWIPWKIYNRCYCSFSSSVCWYRYRNIIQHYCISSCLEEISVQKGMSTFGVCIVLSFFFSVSQYFFYIALRTIPTVTWSRVSFLAHLSLQLKLP